MTYKLDLALVMRDLLPSMEEGALPKNAVVVDIPAVGGSPRSVYVMSPVKLTLSSTTLEQIRSKYVREGWPLERVNATIGAMLDPPVCALEGVGGQATFHVSQSAGVDLFLQNNKASLVPEAWRLLIQSLETPNTYEGTDPSNKNVIAAQRRRAIIEASLDCPGSLGRRVGIAELRAVSTMVWVGPGYMHSQDGGIVTALSKAWSATEQCLSEVLVVIKNGKSVVGQAGDTDYIMLAVPRSPAMNGMVCVSGSFVYMDDTKGSLQDTLWEAISGSAEMWRAQPPFSRSPLASLLGAPLATPPKTTSSWRANYFPQPPDWDNRLLTATGHVYHSGPMYLYGWAGAAEGLTAVGQLDVVANDGVGGTVAYVRFKTHSVKTYMSKASLQRALALPADAKPEDVARAQENRNQLAAAPFALVCAQSVQSPVPINTFADRWIPYVKTIDSGGSTDDVELAPGVTMTKAMQRARAQPATRDLMWHYGWNISTGPLRDGVIVVSGVYDPVAGFSSFTYMTDNGPIDTDAAKTSVICGSILKFTVPAGTTSTAMLAGLMTAWTGAPNTAEGFRQDNQDTFDMCLPTTRRVLEPQYALPLGDNWIGGQYSVDAASSDRAKNCADLHSQRGFSFSHRLPVRADLPSSIRSGRGDIAVVPANLW